MRENLHVDIGILIPALAFGPERLLEAAAAIEGHHRAVGAVLPRAAEFGVRRMVVPDVRLLCARNLTAQSPHAEAIGFAAVDRHVETAKIDLPHAQAGAEIVVRD